MRNTILAFIYLRIAGALYEVRRSDKLWRMLKRLTSNVKTELDQKYLDNARKIQAYQIGYFSVNIDLIRMKFIFIIMMNFFNGYRWRRFINIRPMCLNF